MLKTFQRSLEKKRAQEGFTLIELLVVILIIGILAAIVVVAVSGSTGDASAKACTQDAANLNSALDSYQVANNGKYPVATAATAAVDNTAGDLAASTTFATGAKAYLDTELSALVPAYIKTLPPIGTSATSNSLNVSGKKAEVEPVIDGSSKYVAVLCLVSGGKSAGL